MVISINWLFDAFLLLFSLHVVFLLFFHFWNVGLTFSCYVLFPCFILLDLFFELCVVFFLRTLLLLHTVLLDVPQLSYLNFLLPPRVLLILRIFPQNFIKTTKLFSKLSIQHAPNTHMWLFRSHSGLFPAFPC
jgi:hypothetical protein